jgi:hypothetical protein
MLSQRYFNAFIVKSIGQWPKNIKGLSTDWQLDCCITIRPGFEQEFVALECILHVVDNSWQSDFGKTFWQL